MPFLFVSVVPGRIMVSLYVVGIVSPNANFHFPDRSPNREAFLVDYQAYRDEKCGANQHG